MKDITETERTPKFSSMAEMKRWQAEREDRLHSEQVRERIQQLAAERESEKQRTGKPAKAVKKSPR